MTRGHHSQWGASGAILGASRPLLEVRCAPIATTVCSTVNQYLRLLSFFCGWWPHSDGASTRTTHVSCGTRAAALSNAALTATSCAFPQANSAPVCATFVMSAPEGRSFSATSLPAWSVQSASTPQRPSTIGARLCFELATFA